MNTATKIALVSLTGSAVGLAASCTLILGPFEPIASEC
jgi:hypothetical protein